jgi:glycosyltransferase involved in cell wall biosynthesis
MAHDLGVAEQVVFVGVQADPIPYYNAADIFVMLSEHEANSVASIEAMACALPVVAANTGGFVEVVEPSMGRLIDIHDAHAVERAILELAQDPSLRRELGSCGRQAVIGRHSWEHVAERALAIFREELA